MVVNHAISPKDDISEYGVTIRACYDFLSSYPNFGISFVRRRANSVAHSLVRATLFTAVPVFFIMFLHVLLL